MWHKYWRKNHEAELVFLHIHNLEHSCAHWDVKTMQEVFNFVMNEKKGSFYLLRHIPHCRALAGKWIDSISCCKRPHLPQSRQSEWIDMDWLAHLTYMKWGKSGTEWKYTLKINVPEARLLTPENLRMPSNCQEEFCSLSNLVMMDLCTNTELWGNHLPD